VNARRRVEYIRKLIEEIGLEGRRLQMINISAAMGGQFAWSAAELTEEIRQLGPNPLGDGGGVWANTPVIEGNESE
jgi:F420-non-reducing hydrogenase iron-sulfur subunit